ncbi:Protein indc11 [Neonectria ditissima]|uniref:Protein indc11 n=1 Tax=Neonectria ditissima TaxID=78410 RepID=A0A0P7B8F3_9HYPO|nr:Protein indc11 [Neonectria ditissima]
MSTTIRKAVISGFGDVSNINIVTADIASPGQNEVQVSIIYAGFSGTDINMRLGVYPMQRAAPLTPGYCFVGRVRSNGPGSTRYQPGDIVTALSMYDSHAELINISEKHLIPVPTELDLKQAAALTVDWNTAYGMVTRAAKVSKGQRVFVHGLSGAVGYAIMALCQGHGAIVYGTASERNHIALKELGVTPFVYTDKDWITAMQALGGVHAAFDPLGFQSYDESYSILSVNEQSMLIGYGGNLATLTGQNTGSVYPSILKLMARNLKCWTKRSTKFHYITRDDDTFQSDLKELMKMASDGRVNVPIKCIWDLEDIKKAHVGWANGTGMGSTLISIASNY